MLKKILLLFLLAFNFAYAFQGSCTGFGETKGAAYIDAISRVPSGAQVYQKFEFKHPYQWKIVLMWKK